MFGRVQLAEIRDEKREPADHAERTLVNRVRSEDGSRMQRGLERLGGSQIFSMIDTEGPVNPFSGDWGAADHGLVPPNMDKILELPLKKDRTELKFWESFEGMAIFAEIERPPNGAVGEDEHDEDGAKRSYHQPLLYIKHTAGGLVEMQPCFNGNTPDCLALLTLCYHTVGSMLPHYPLTIHSLLAQMSRRLCISLLHRTVLCTTTRLKTPQGSPRYCGCCSA